MHDKLQAIREKRANGEGGFTLIELLVVVVIIGILIAIAIPLYLNYQKGAHDKSAQSDLRGSVSALNQCFTENNNSYPLLSAVTNVAGSAATFSCNGTTETANLSSGTTFVYTPYSDTTGTTACATAPCASFLVTATNSGGHGNVYTYKSWLGGQIS